MPKAKARKKSSVVRSGQVSRTATVSARNTTITGETTADKQTATVRSRRATSKQAGGVQGMIMPGMVALGCWGMAFTFVVFSTDPNHLLFGGMAALMAIMWSVSFGVRLRKVLHRR